MQSTNFTDDATVIDRRWRVVVPKGVQLVRYGFDEEPSDSFMSDLLDGAAASAAVYPPDGKAPDALADAVDFVTNDSDCERLNVSAEQARAVIRALGGVRA